jgi:hypothetical protein
MSTPKRNVTDDPERAAYIERVMRRRGLRVKTTWPKPATPQDANRTQQEAQEHEE